MKQFIAIIAATGILMQSFSTVVIVASYYANKNYIAANLCENRNKPLMHCEGKCCLKKKLAKESQNQAPSPKNQKSADGYNLFFSFNQIEAPVAFFAATEKTFFRFDELGTVGLPRSMFHPPSIVFCS